ncbi:hypothetical protein MAIT1_01289 [Magnetofaba australis IT-1]|uniref:Uncharacterized protein n=1 Tax=Magnetofaba australis IT-1 TaxID=1434232 RepID=A0A1Y2K160_9PROT|nr:hypothetical protein MAIT1_01289 [Magnetofaba australis IT-1]
MSAQDALEILADLAHRVEADEAQGFYETALAHVITVAMLRGASCDRILEVTEQACASGQLMSHFLEGDFHNDA